MNQLIERLNNVSTEFNDTWILTEFNKFITCVELGREYKDYKNINEIAVKFMVKINKLNYSLQKLHMKRTKYEYKFINNYEKQSKYYDKITKIYEKIHKKNEKISALESKLDELYLNYN